VFSKVYLLRVELSNEITVIRFNNNYSLVFYSKVNTRYSTRAQGGGGGGSRITLFEARGKGDLG